ncbi:MAG: multifunctional oxoglutarate decarboxylase/oxoglutarate dehydrogenase thiamine pyrophosphate-binding subunit/dihydrolipoyllysine-residue succinyltransferase subunit [Holophagales bacterium]|nr:multifunctional oxoglutarate decarboxylase/oxoglutarate dehydrogenase thiamine pyrophosphate-binding subunit/dihydrolipoyllysine-residue succinyltransferase subunit [Holophagales bacterium]
MHDAVLDALSESFGDNAGFALELYAQYRLNPGSVGEDWRRTFEQFEKRIRAGGGVRTDSSALPAGTPDLQPPAPPASGAAVPGGVQAPPARAAAPTLRPGEKLLPLVGGSATIARNMDASLTVPTATSQRVIPVKAMEENRRILNHHREAVRQSKISFTHLVAWAIVRALEKHPGLNDAYAEAEGRPQRVRKPHVNLGVAVDVTKKDGSRTLLVPNIKLAEELDFAEFVATFDNLVGKARRGTIEPEAFLGTSISLTNPGTLGTTSSAPRLMPGQGCIVATGAMGYPPEYQAMPEEIVASLGISRTMAVTSTYDHRIVQGAESGAFLATLQELLLGVGGFYERIFKDLKVPHRPVAWEPDRNPPLLGGSSRLETVEKQARILPLINFYRVRGHLLSDLDPLGVDTPPYHGELDPATFGYTLWDLDRKFVTNGLAGRDHATLREILEVLRQTYCGKIGAEFMNIQDPEQKKWLMDRMESCRNLATLSVEDKTRALAKLVEAESFEKFLHAKYVGHKRFSLEGGEAAIPLMTRLLDRAAGFGIEEAVIGMSHRGRLTLLTSVVGKPVSQIFAEFEDVLDPQSIQGSGDVKYHLGAVGTHEAPDGTRVRVGLAPNPSHLEAVDPVVEGMVRAKQERAGDAARERILPILLHGDAAFAGQGLVAETLNMCQLDGYRTGGTIHVIVNNQIGFTTNPKDARSSPYCTDVAKMVQAPIFHVNGDDPEAVLHVVDLAMEYRKTFRHDAVIDMVCYRRYGHNEGDEPSYTQPLLYQKIRNHSSVARLYGDALVRDGVLTAGEVEQLWVEAKQRLERAYDAPAGSRTRGAFSDSLVAPAAPRYEPGGDVREKLARVVKAVSTLPAGFDVHPKLRPLLKKRADYASGRPEIDWAGGEMLAFGMLLLEGTPVRLSGQDSGRGTFSHRHSVLADPKTGAEFVPLNAIAEPQARFEVIDSFLSEAGVMGFEFGYAVADPSTLVLWEAQFGDFANGAQVIIDQFIAGSEQKWSQTCDLVLLLPHGQEGQGPEHSSARLERFLTLCAENNMSVANVTTPAQYYHLLMRQMRDDVRRPLIVMSPKSLLRHPKAVSTFDEIAGGSFQPVLDDAAFAAGGADGVRRIVLASGKLVYELLAAREKAARPDVAIVRLEELYPFPGEALGRVLARYPQDATLVFAQEEPKNMGAWRFVREQFLEGAVPGAGPGRPLNYAGRRFSASPAPGSHHIFAMEQEGLVADALGVEAEVPASA